MLQNLLYAFVDLIKRLVLIRLVQAILLTVAFGIGLYQRVRADDRHRGKVMGSMGAVVLVAEGLFGSITLFFPEDMGGADSPITSSGMMHIVFAGLCSLTTMLAILLMGFWFRNIPRLRGYGLYSFISVGVVFLSGGLAAASIASQSPAGGLIERITIGGFLQWLFVIALALYSSQATSASPTSK